MRVLLLDGHYPHSIAIAAELVQELGAEIHGTVLDRRSHLARSQWVTSTQPAPLPTSPQYTDRILEIVHELRPDVVVPVGFDSFQAVISLRERLPPCTTAAVPDAHAFAVAADKERTYELAESVGVRSPRQIGRVDGGVVVEFTGEFPVFAKSVHERGGVSTALLQDRHAFTAFDWSVLGGDVLLQEFIDTGPETFGYDAFYHNGKARIAVQHIEKRSAPRRGGSATRIGHFHDAQIARAGHALLAALKWTGAAQVEFKRDRTGQWVLMEINPKFWASYAHTSRSEAKIAAASVRDACGLSPLPPRLSGFAELDTVFPFREAAHLLRERAVGEVAGALVALLVPPAGADIRPRDLWSHLPLPSKRR